jgi:hypothetical protein
MLLYSLIASAISSPTPNQDCAPTNFQPCLDTQKTYLDTTCEPLSSKNATFYGNIELITLEICKCYNLVNVGFCYKQCPGNIQVQQQLAGTVEPQIIAQCGLPQVSLNPNRLPQPPIWVTFFPSSDSGSASVTASASPTSSQSTQATVAANRSGASSYEPVSSLVFAMIFGYFL